MDTDVIIIIATAFCSFMIPALLYNFEIRKAGHFSDKSLAFLPLYAGVLIPACAAYFIFYDVRDFLASFSVLEALVMFGWGLLLFLSSRWSKTSRFFPLFILAGAVICSLLMPDDAAAGITPLPAIYNRIILALAWWFFAYIYRYSNTGDGMTALQSLTIAVGIGILGFINAIPMFIGIAGLVFAMTSLALLVFTMPPARLHIDGNEASCIGFLLFGIMAWVAGENAGSCVLIYALFLLIDFIWALGLRMSFVADYSDIMQNTAYRVALSSGYSPKSALGFACRGQILLLVFGSFEALSGVQGSLLLISSFVTLWILYKLRNLSESLGIRDINRQVLDDLQARVNEVKQYLHGDDDI